MRALNFLVLFFAATVALGAPQVGKNLPPYTMLVIAGDERGKLHCYVCEHGGKEGVILFARQPGKTQGEIASWMERQPKSRPQFHGWVTFLEKDPGSDKPIFTWAEENKLRQTPVGRFEEESGPPAYLIGEKDTLLALYFRQGKVAATFRAGNPEEEKQIIAGLEKELKKHGPLPSATGEKAGK